MTFAGRLCHLRCRKQIFPCPHWLSTEPLTWGGDLARGPSKEGTKPGSRVRGRDEMLLLFPKT